MSKKTFKASLKSEIDRKIPNVLHKINLEEIHIIEKEQEKSRFKRPVLRLVTSLSFAIIILFVVGVFALRNRPTGPDYTKEDRAIMASVVQAYQLSGANATAEIPNVTLSSDNDEDNGDYRTEINNIFDGIFKEIDVYFESVETLLFIKDFKYIKSDNNTNELNFESQHLSGAEINYTTKFTTFENEDGTVYIEGSLYLGSSLVTTFTSNIATNKVITTELSNGIKVTSWASFDENLKVDVNTFEIAKTVTDGVRVSTIRKYHKDGKDVIELKPESFTSNRNFQFITSKDNKGNDIVEVVINENFRWFNIGNQFRVIISSIETDFHIKYTYDFKGTINIAIAGIDFEYEFQTHSVHEKRRPKRAGY